MKRSLFFFFILCMALSLHAVEIVGHRGSIYGVENTRDAYLNGVQQGYWGLECDVRTAADGRFVISHDPDLARLGQPGVSIADTPSDSLVSLTLTQTRRGVTYTGHLCRLEEYLDICRQYGKVPVVELKWATGVNSGDQSMMPSLMWTIAEHCRLDSVVILTSMKPCLEWIRSQQEYGGVTLWWLCTPKTEVGQLDWCREHHFDIDIDQGFDRALIKQYHDAGLKVGVWTVDDQAAFDALVPQVDFITTDYLK